MEADVEEFLVGLYRFCKGYFGKMDATNQKKLPETPGGEEKTPSVLCERCGRDIYKISKTPKKTLEYSNKYHGGDFCYNCQQIRRKQKVES